MPVKRCTKDGKKGWQYGNQKCFTGKDAKRRAHEQGAAIRKSGYKG